MPQALVEVGARWNGTFPGWLSSNSKAWPISHGVHRPVAPSDGHCVTLASPNFIRNLQYQLHQCILASVLLYYCERRDYSHASHLMESQGGYSMPIVRSRLHFAYRILGEGVIVICTCFPTSSVGDSYWPMFSLVLHGRHLFDNAHKTLTRALQVIVHKTFM